MKDDLTVLKRILKSFGRYTDDDPIGGLKPYYFYVLDGTLKNNGIIYGKTGDAMSFFLNEFIHKTKRGNF